MNKIATRSHIFPTTIERGVMWVCYPCDIFISVLCFQNYNWISALGGDRKTMAFDLKGWLLPLANVRREINGLMSFIYDLSLSV
jgi:hypothetical protein